MSVPEVPAPSAKPERAPKPSTPRPRREQALRTWYFFRRNYLAMIGFGILVVIVVIALVAAFLPLPWTTLTTYCGTEQVTPNSYNSTNHPSNPSTLVVPGVSNGTYDYRITHIAGYTTNWTGSVRVDGTSPDVSVVFSPIRYPATFTESGLPSGTQWNLTLTGTGTFDELNSTTPTISAMVANGSYSFSVGSVGHYTPSPSSGVVSVDGAPTSQPITYTLGALPEGIAAGPAARANVAVPTNGSASYNYTITFTETGLSAAALEAGWSLTINTTSAPSTLCTIGGVFLCTYPSTSQSPGVNCYQYPSGSPAIIPPTFKLTPFTVGPLPLGSLSVGPPLGSGPSDYRFYNLYDALLRGSDWTLLIALSVVAAGAGIGLLLGSTAGLAGGIVEEGVMRLVDIFLSIPQLLFVVVVVSVLIESGSNTSIVYLILALIVIWWPFYARIVRGQVLVVREQKYVEAARASGASGPRVLLRHIIPNSVYPVFIQMSLDIGTVPLLLGALVFLGFRIFPTTGGATGNVPFPEWGSITANAVTIINPNIADLCSVGSCYIPWWQFLFPGLALFLFAISVNLFSDGLRDALDPRLRR